MGRSNKPPQMLISCVNSEAEYALWEGEIGIARGGRTSTGSTLTLELANDHRMIEHELQLLSARVNQPQSSRRSSNSALHNHLVQALNEHFRKEERLLYPRLSHALGSELCDRLRREHTQIMTIAKKSNQKGFRSLEAFGQLRQLFQAHISTEENVLFWYFEIQRASPRPPLAR